MVCGCLKRKTEQLLPKNQQTRNRGSSLKNNLSIAILQNNPEWARFGEPITPYRWQRTTTSSATRKTTSWMNSVCFASLSHQTTRTEWFIPQLFTECTLKVRSQSANVKPEWADTYNAFHSPVQSPSVTTLLKNMSVMLSNSRTPHPCS